MGGRESAGIPKDFRLYMHSVGDPEVTTRTKNMKGVSNTQQEKGDCGITYTSFYDSVPK
jgi:hypothetical protein